MPSIEAVEKFKTIVQGLAREPEIRAEMGLPAEEILPPESQLDDDLADLLGGMPSGEPSADAAGSDEEFSPSGSEDLDDLFSSPVPAHDEEPSGPSLDDLLGPVAPPSDPFADLFGADTGAGDLGEDPFANLGAAPAFDEPSAVDDLWGEPAPEAPEDFGSLEEPEALEEPETLEEPDEIAPAQEAEEEPFDFDSLLGPDPIPAPVDQGRRAHDGVSPEDMDDAFFDTPGEDLFGKPSPPAAEDEDFEFGDGMSDTDFPELAGFADTKEEDVEAFDAMGEADEFQLGDFESQFGITADDHTDAELLNPAQAIDIDVAAGQRTLSLSDDDFLTVQRALGHLPLNLRLAVEELIGEKEVVFEDIDKVVRLLVGQAPARTLASAVGKILGRKIVIPPGFEKGSGADLEARHGTLWYNIRTIMLPVLRVAGVVSVVVAILIVLGWNFLLRPWKANDLYEKGLVAAQHDAGAQADDLFAQAWYEWPVQERFFQYAEVYQDTGDYDRARRKYLELLKPSVKPYQDGDKARLEDLFGKPLAALPQGLEGQALLERLAAKKAALDAYYAYVTRLLSVSGAEGAPPGDIAGDVILGNPDAKGILDYSRFETDFGFDGRDREAHFRRADAILRPLLADRPGDKDGLLRKADNYLVWTKALSSKEILDQANSTLSEYLRIYGYDAPVTWRFVRVFLLEDQESELLKFRDRIFADKKMAMDGETLAQLAGWFLDRHDSAKEQAKVVPVTQRTMEEEYGIRPKLVDPATAEPVARAHVTAETSRSLPLAEGEAAAGGEASKAVELKAPFKYPNTFQPFQPDYLDKIDSLLLRAMDTQKTLPELHWELSRFYRAAQATSDEQRALAAADTYFQRLEPRKTRLNDRPTHRVETSNRIGEIFDGQGQPLQAEKYYLNALKNFEAFQAEGLTVLDGRSAQVYRNLGNLYYRQTPGVDSAGHVPGGWDQALKLFETFEKGHQEDPAVTYRLGVIHYEKKEFAQAVQKFFTLDRQGNLGEVSGRSNPNLLYAMGNALFRSGNFSAAEGYYRELLAQLRAKRAQITEFDPAVRTTHKALAQRLYETWNNLAAAEYRAANAFRAGTPEFREALASLTTARAQTQILGRDLFENKEELDITLVDAGKLQAIRDDEARILAKTRQEKGLVEANFLVLTMVETAPPSRRAALAGQLEIFTRVPLELEQSGAP